MIEKKGMDVTLMDAGLRAREKRNAAYLFSLSNENLLRNFELEAGRFTNREIDTKAMGGWESSTCQLRGHFLGHWLSAAALYYSHTLDRQILAKTEAIVDGLAACQKDNGDGWAASIPEKYLIWIGQGRNIWAPQYTIHKLFMGLLDVYRYMKNLKALEIADCFADWFYDWSGRYTREQFDDILDYETGGMLEVWADLLAATGKDKYRTLLKRYYRERLFEPLLEGKDVLTNMHANTTIPEVLGCARAYEVTGEQKYLDIVKAYWKCAVTDRGMFATGGQTQGEIWTPKLKLRARLGKKNQEFCTVYNMMRLAEFLFLQTEDPAFLQYREYNLYNGVLAQTYYESEHTESHKKNEGLLTYFLPMQAACRKNWSGRMDAFYCCHGTMVQANARLNEGIFYQDGNDLVVGQYIDSKVRFTLPQKEVLLTLREDLMNGLTQVSSVNDGVQTVNDDAAVYDERPPFRKFIIQVKTEEEAGASVLLRIPEWSDGMATVFRNGKCIGKTEDNGHFFRIPGPLRDGEEIVLQLPIAVKYVPLPDDTRMGAFRYGPLVLAGITQEERVLYSAGSDPAEELASQNERQWGTWNTCFHTVHQDPGIEFVPISEIGTEAYQIYFQIEEK